MLEKEKLLELVEAMATHSDAEWVECDIAQGRKITKREKRMAKVLTEIYMFIHGQGRCQHQDWQIKARETYGEFIKNGMF